MSANTRCPVGSERIDEYAARVNGAMTVVMLGATFWEPMRWLLLYLLLDYAIKLLAGFAYSPGCFVARHIADALGMPRESVPAAPKRFAGGFALIFLGGGLIAWYAAASFIAFAAFTSVFLVCTALDSFAGFCVGCYIYSLLPARIGNAFVR